MSFRSHSFNFNLPPILSKQERITPKVMHKFPAFLRLKISKGMELFPLNFQKNKAFCCPGTESWRWTTVIACKSVKTSLWYASQPVSELT